MGNIIQFSMLGRFGRFGNSLFQYAFAKAYARSTNSVLETPPWIGQTLFKDINDPPLSRQLPQTQLDKMPQPGETNIDLFGYCQHAAAFSLYTLSDVRQWFTFHDHWLEETKDYLPLPLVAHLRRGDYETTYSNTFCIIDESAYRDAMFSHGWGNVNPTWVSENNPIVFKRPGLEWLIDFVTLMRAEVLFRANSSFSWWAATLGTQRLVYSPVVDGLRGHQKTVPFVPGNRPRVADLPNCDNYIIQP